MKKPKRISAMILSFLMIISLAFPQASLESYAAEEADGNPYGGQDYYLDYSGGDDLKDGMTPETAWKNLDKANETVFSPGDRILLKCGETWENQQLWPKGSGEEGKPITIDRYGDVSLGNPYIATNGNVEYPITSGSKDKNKVGLTGAIVLRNQQYFEIHNMELSNDDDFETNITTGNYVRDGICITINADLLGDGEDNIMNYFRITNNYIHDIDGKSTWQQIHYGGICFQVFGEKGYNEYDTGGYYFQDVVIENNSFNKTELHAIQFAFNWFYDRSAQYGEYDEANKYHEGWEQLWVRTRDLYSRDVYIGHNYCEDIGQGAIQLANTKDMVVEYNEINGFLKRYNQVSCGLYLWAGANTVMQFNEVYDGPYDEYDGTPFDMEYTNFDVVYQYNYSHDNKAGWMSYMGNSSNSIARYNLSVNDNGVIVKNMLSTNYAPSYFVNNVFIYDASQMDYFHDEVFKDTVYFYNNIFYNYSDTTTTPWYRRSNALANAEFSNNVYYEASGTYSALQPKDNYAILEDPQFVSDPLDYATDLGVDNIVSAAQIYKLEDTSPLIDAGHYSAASGTEDFFGTHLYYGEEIDIGLYEAAIGEKVDNPVEKEFVEDNEPERVNLALNKPITANYTHPTTTQNVKVENLVDGNTATRWACCDPNDMTLGYPIIITIDFEEEVQFNEIYLDEYSDNQTNLRIQSFELQKWVEGTSEWITFKKVESGMGHDLTLADFGVINSSKLRLLITGQKTSEYWTPSMTEIQAYYNEEIVEPPVEANPSLVDTAAVYDLAESMKEEANNKIAIELDLDGDTVSGVEYYGSEGNKLREMYEGDEYIILEDVYNISSTFLNTLKTGQSTIKFVMASGRVLEFSLEVVDTTELEAAINEAEQLLMITTFSNTAQELQNAIASAKIVLNKVNRTVTGMGNTSVNQEEIDTVLQALLTAITNYTNGAKEDVDKTMLKQSIDYAESVKLNYPANLIEAIRIKFEDALLSAWDIYNNDAATQDEVDTIDETLIKMIQHLAFTADLQGLEEAIDYAEELIASGSYIENAEMEAYKTLVENAKSAYEDVTITDTEIGAMIAALIEAEGALSPVVTLNTKNLESEILKSEATLLDIAKGLYLEVGQTEFKTALEAAKSVLNNPASQNEIDEAVYKLRETRLNLRLVPNKEVLATLLAEAKQVKESLYTQESILVLRNAVAYATEIYDDSQADAALVKEAEVALTEALKKLALIETKDTGDTEDTKGTEETKDSNKVTDTEGTDDTTATGNKAGINKNPTGGLKASSVKTADYAPIAGLIGIAAVSGLIAIWVLKKRKKLNASE